MKKWISVVLASLFLVACSNGSYQEPKVDQKMDIPYKLELKSSKANMSGYKYIRGKVADFKEVSASEALRLMDEKGTGVLYLGYDTCPFCVRAVPELNEAMKRSGVSVYYVNTTRMNEVEANAFLAKFSEVLKANGDHSDGLYVPIVVSIKDGVPVAEQTSLVKGFVIENESSQLNETQKLALQTIYLNLFQRIAK